MQPRFHIILVCLLASALSKLISPVDAAETGQTTPNVILCMCDDLGFGDVGYNGNKIIQTPHLDAMSRDGLQFNRFYAAAPVCSPTRASCISGRSPFRYGIVHANRGHMKPQELTLAEVLKRKGYATGHFGKWHLGTLTKTIKDSNRGGPCGVDHFAPPWINGFDVCFSTEAKVPTWDPMKKPVANAGRKGWEYLREDDASEHFGTHYWNEKGEIVTDNLEGDNSRIIMDRVVPFVRNAVRANKPFFTVIWFHTPHLPVVAGPKHAQMYKQFDSYKKNYYGCVTAMDEQMGRLRDELKQLNASENTMLWFCGDNGPEGDNSAPGSAGPFRGRKRSLYEGGVRVPGLLVWPAKIRAEGDNKVHRETDMPCCTSDYFPTVLDAVGHRLSGKPRPYDGISLMPLIEGKMKLRPKPIGFQFGGIATWSDNRYKIIGSLKKQNFELYDIIEDPSEKENIAEQHPDIVRRMKADLIAWIDSCKSSAAGNDYN